MYKITVVWGTGLIFPFELLLFNRGEVNQHNSKEVAGLLSFLLHDLNVCFPIGLHLLYDWSASFKMELTDWGKHWG